MNIFLAIPTTVAAVAAAFFINVDDNGQLDPPAIVNTVIETSASPSWEYEIPPFGRVTHTDQIIGALMPPLQEGETPQQIHELVWGITSGGDLGFAILRTADRLGNTTTIEALEKFEKLAFDTSEIGGVNIYADGQSFASLDALSLFIDAEGFLRFAEMSGTKANGETLAGMWLPDDEDPVDPETLRSCGPAVVGGCSPLGGCTAGCNGATDCDCTSGGTGSCISAVGPQCYGTKDCPNGRSCESKKPGDPSVCQCR